MSILATKPDLDKIITKAVKRIGENHALARDNSDISWCGNCGRNCVTFKILILLEFLFGILHRFGLFSVFDFFTAFS